VHVGDDRAQVIVNGWRHAGAYDLATGKELWRIGGGGDIPVPTPVVGHGLAFITNAHGGARPIWAIRLTATGDVSLGEYERENRHVAWSQPRRGNYMQTPLLLGDLLYCSSDSGVLGCYDARTGEEKYQVRLGRGGSGFTASPVGSGGHIFFTSEDGYVHVIREGPEFQPIKVNELGQECLATPAISGGRLYFRCRRQLIAIGPPGS
jgi:outer membrane protein assembly factor BamB